VDLCDDDRFFREAGFHELACIGELLGDGGNEGFVVEGGYALEEFGVGIDLSNFALNNDAQVGITLNSNGTAEYWYADLNTPQTNFIGGSYSWLLTGANTDYYAFMDTPSSGSFYSSSATNTALQLNTSRTWIAYQAIIGSNSVQSTLRIRTASGVDIVSQPVSLYVEVF
jgi:hypothetical protein